MLKIENLTKSYGKVKALDEVSFNINKGMYGLLGPNGAGKTTLMRTLVTLMPIEKGEISYKDIKWNEAKKVRELIGYLPQEFSMHKNLTVYEVLKYIGTLKEIKNENIENDIEFVLKKTKLIKDKNKKVSELSGGMVRRLGIAQAILGNPEILTVDEPTAGLDPKKRIGFRNLLNELGQDKTIIISTHIVEDIEATCDQVCVLDRGKILYEGSIIDMKNIVKDKVYEIVINKKEFHKISRILKIISSKVKDKDELIVRFIDEKNDLILENIKKVEAVTLEDAYFYLVGDEEDE